MPYIKADVKGVFGKKTIAKCPKCDKIHNIYEDWRGNGILRRYCQPCKHLVDNMSGGMDEGSSFNRHAVMNNRN